MKVKNQLKGPAAPNHRAGEGILYDVEAGPVTDGDLPGLRSQTFGIKLNEAVVPDRKYAASAYAVVATGHDVVHFVFGQQKLVGDGLRSMLDIQLTRKQAENFIASIEGKSWDTVLSTPPFRLNEEPEQTIGLVASFAIGAATEEDGTLDFYYASAFTLRNIALGAKKAPVEGVVRVTMAAGLFHGILEHVREVLNTSGTTKS